MGAEGFCRVLHIAPQAVCAVVLAARHSQCAPLVDPSIAIRQSEITCREGTNTARASVEGRAAVIAVTRCIEGGDEEGRNGEVCEGICEDAVKTHEV